MFSSPSGAEASSANRMRLSVAPLGLIEKMITLTRGRRASGALPPGYRLEPLRGSSLCDTGFFRYAFCRPSAALVPSACGASVAIPPY